MRLKKHARMAIKAAQAAARALGCEATLLREPTGKNHYRMAVTRAGREIGRFSISETPTTPDDTPNIARQDCRRVIKAAG